MANESTPRVTVPGSEREPLSGAELRGPVAPEDVLTVTVMLRRPPGARIKGTQGEGEALSREEAAASFAAAPGDVDAVAAFAADHGLDVAERIDAARLVKLRGPASAMSAAFGVSLAYYERDGVRYRGREGALTVPAHLEGIVEAVVGLDSRPQVRPHIVAVDEAAPAAPAALRSFTPIEVADLYGFPPGTDGTGQSVGILEFGGGFQQSDLDHYFSSLGLQTPRVVAVGVDGAANSPGDPADVEVVLDVDVVGAIAPQAATAVYFAPNTDQGFIDAVAAAIHDTANKPDVISISWGAPERFWTAQTMSALDGLFADARAMGISVMVAAGDHGSADEPQTIQQNGVPVKNPAYDGRAHVDFPASSPNATGCGGTRLEAAGGMISAETVWNDNNGWATGGGVSDVFALPAWQQGRHVPPSVNPGHHSGRGVPDVAGDADNVTGYQIYVNGRSAVVGGTSAVAPLWSGLAARLRELSGGTLRLDNAWLYARPSSAFRDIASGTNAIAAADSQPGTKGYTAGQGWDACTGLGAPNGAGLAAAVQGSPAG
ncbi:S53 family peptidase [Sinomonas sp. JGH33]|uniref:S53 family peptidase n=1 Tax=Sinomonas terricola TaxID=3110330 RepID=A0ABU5TBW8_9MICC|nr:S53 family peptidase [Sinomonas sp. JGH33]MEA5457188.1 S53 family peptidase [Sinomonas sp. JGH33]